MRCFGAMLSWMLFCWQLMGPVVGEFQMCPYSIAWPCDVSAWVVDVTGVTRCVGDMSVFALSSTGLGWDWPTLFPECLFLERNITISKLKDVE